MQHGKIVKKVIVCKKGKRLKLLYGRVGFVQLIDQDRVEIIIDGSTYTLQKNAVERLPYNQSI